MQRTTISILLACVLFGIAGTLLHAIAPQEREPAPLADFVAVSPTGTSYEPRPREKILFIGDMMFDRTLRRETSDEYELLLAGAAAVLREHDMVVGNLEGPVTTFPSKSVGTLPDEEGNTTFTFPPHLLPVLRGLHVGAVSIGNNHILDFGGEGLAQTRQYLADAGIRFVGDPSEHDNPLVLSLGGVRVGLVSYNEFFFPPRLSRDPLDRALKDIKKVEPSVDFTVVFAHWGEEYVLEPPASVRSVAHALVEAGADLVVGSHPHVIQPVERYRGATVYYSLGNFAFDQYWDDSVRTGLGVSLSFSETGEARLSEYAVEISPETGVSMHPADRALPPLSTVE